MATVPELLALLDGHVTLEVECLDRLYLNGYIGKLATGPGLMMFMRGQLGKPIVIQNQGPITVTLDRGIARIESLHLTGPDSARRHRRIRRTGLRS